ncbi:phosphoadenylyl-sulfate reductase [Beggiatoa leptomitoformis]|uniref:Adenosine 5'-phosphosulfate reductase n=1 Tax=Beggiatoa leptomitoformis TaxID=288004 RepID=A0A2N9YHU6_9GAMM|nr:phosphoadenylyl-sulfate reductase [Beggiatoa leptomitoformis]ALG67785.1 phosphoadenylyl-sulfate reductase [Beggiatoa leptomitoformis]AUI69969.1 phosphoadenylyl-sulfate reductase [Beggiatoa leptomitoformis]
MMVHLTEQQIQTHALDYATQSPKAILQLALQHYEKISIAFSGAEDVVLIDMAYNLLKKPIEIFCLDTGRLHAETYRFLETVRTHYQCTLTILYPDATAVEQLIKEKGFFSFLQEGHQECCGIRKVAPLTRKLNTLDAWITGQRKDQSLDTRAQLSVIEIDKTFSTVEHPLVKFNPLANWTSAQVWNYIQLYEVPYNLLHERGFVSIGCEPCTRAVLPHQHEREGRWWWEAGTKKECGLHASNTISTHKPT